MLQLFADVFRYLTATGRHVAERVPTREPIVATSLNNTYETNNTSYDPHNTSNDPNNMYDPHEPYATDPRFRHLDRNQLGPRRFNNYSNDRMLGFEPDTNHRYEIDKLTTV